MANFSDSVTRALGASAVAGRLGANIGGSVSAVFGPFAPGGAVIGGCIGSIGGAACSLLFDLSD